MSTLLDIPRPVQSGFPRIAETTPDDEPFHPSPVDLAYDLGYRLARDGETPATPPGPGAVRWAFVRGRQAGSDARAAYELGYALGWQTELSHPPGGYSEGEAAEFRRGFSAGKAAFEDDREWLAWLASVESDRMDDAFGADITDADVYPMGVS
jgi:hypothetical protein